MFALSLSLSPKTIFIVHHHRFEDFYKMAERMSWDSNMDDGLIESLVESIKAGKKNGRSWDESVWEPAKNVVFNKSQKVVRKS
ncbi:hypothetical protein GIB67_021774, partial [Kingdonia uniflora]